MIIGIVNPESPELAEYRKIYDFASQFGTVTLTRNTNGYASTVCRIEGEMTVEEYALYPTVPNAGIAQLKSDILAIYYCLRSLGVDVKFLDHEVEVKQEKVSKSKLNSCNTVKEIVSILESVNHPSLVKVKHFIEQKRISGGRPSKLQVIDVVFEDEVEETVRQPQRTGMRWSEARKLWVNKFAESKFTKMYKSLDDFCTFAPDELVFRNIGS